MVMQYIVGNESPVNVLRPACLLWKYTSTDIQKVQVMIILLQMLSCKVLAMAAVVFQFELVPA